MFEGFKQLAKKISHILKSYLTHFSSSDHPRLCSPTMVTKSPFLPPKSKIFVTTNSKNIRMYKRRAPLQDTGKQNPFHPITCKEKSDSKCLEPPTGHVMIKLTLSHLDKNVYVYIHKYYNVTDELLVDFWGTPSFPAIQVYDLHINCWVFQYHLTL